jgi:hypothetical protein
MVALALFCVHLVIQTAFTITEAVFPHRPEAARPSRQFFGGYKLDYGSKMDLSSCLRLPGSPQRAPPETNNRSSALARGNEFHAVRLVVAAQSALHKIVKLIPPKPVECVRNSFATSVEERLRCWNASGKLREITEAPLIGFNESQRASRVLLLAKAHQQKLTRREM